MKINSTVGLFKTKLLVFMAKFSNHHIGGIHTNTVNKKVLQICTFIPIFKLKIISNVCKERDIKNQEKMK